MCALSWGCGMRFSSVFRGFRVGLDWAATGIIGDMPNGDACPTPAGLPLIIGKAPKLRADGDCGIIGTGCNLTGDSVFVAFGSLPSRNDGDTGELGGEGDSMSSVLVVSLPMYFQTINRPIKQMGGRMMKATHHHAKKDDSDGWAERTDSDDLAELMTSTGETLALETLLPATVTVEIVVVNVNVSSVVVVVTAPKSPPNRPTVRAPKDPPTTPPTICFVCSEICFLFLICFDAFDTSEFDGFPAESSILYFGFNMF